MALRPSILLALWLTASDAFSTLPAALAPSPRLASGPLGRACCPAAPPTRSNRLSLRMADMKAAEEDEDEFTVTWEHADGTTDTMKGSKLEENPPGEPIQPVVVNNSPLARLKRALGNFFGGGAKMDKQKLAALGTSALLSYGFVSNVTYSTCVIVAWIIFGRQYGVSPLATGQWPKFLAVYGGFWMFQNFARPARFALSVGLSPYFDRFVGFVQRKASQITGRNINKATAFGIVVFIVNIVGTTSYLAGGLILSTRIAGVPLLPPGGFPIRKV